MKKRGQAEVIKYLIIAIIIAVITFSGYSIINKMGNKACKTELAKFEIDLKNLDKQIKFGSSKEFIQTVPCNADKIYFFDLNKEINLEFLKNVPLLRDSVESKAQKNVFILKDNKIISSFYAGNLDLDFPNYVCFTPISSRINFFLEGKGNQVSITGSCSQPECTFVSETFDVRESVDILFDAQNYGTDTFCNNCPTYFESIKFDYFSDLVKTNANVDTLRKYQFCKENGKTFVEILFQPKKGVQATNFVYYESIPGSCKSYVRKNFSGSGVRDVSRDDSLMLWSINLNQKISYTLETQLSDECKKGIKSFGFAKDIKGGKIVEEPKFPLGLERGEESEIKPIELYEIPIQTVNGNIKENQIVINDLTYYSSRTEVGFTILDQTNKNKVDCFVRFKELLCKVNTNENIFSEITLEVFDRGLTDTKKFMINVKKVCEETCGECTELNTCLLTKICTKSDCSTNIIPCDNKFTNGKVCAPNAVCIEGRCKSETKLCEIIKCSSGHFCKDGCCVGGVTDIVDCCGNECFQ